MYLYTCICVYIYIYNYYFFFPVGSVLWEKKAFLRLPSHGRQGMDSSSRMENYFVSMEMEKKNPTAITYPPRTGMKDVRKTRV